MSKNIVIAEGRRGRRFGAVKKLRTKLQGGGDCLWVPEDDVQLESLYAYENGVYRPEQYGFDRASVSVIDASLAPLSTGHNMPSFPPAGTDGFSQVTVNVPTSEQDTYMDAIQWQCIGNPSDKPYSWVRYADLAKEFSSGGRSWITTVKASTLFQSSFPPYINSIDGEPRLCGFIRGENSLRVTYNWENINPSQNPTEYQHAWLKNGVVDYSDNWSENTKVIGGMGICSERKNGEDSLYLYELDSYARVVNWGNGFAAARPKCGGTTFFKQDSTVDATAGVGILRNRNVIAVIVSERQDGPYNYNYLTDDVEYKILNGMSFASMEEWLTWCKTH
ncbi:MAG: hypothetical protein IKD66_00515 [Solobacterium sp.]|nr:hypothetical protein [Solobacterium sp.]